MGDITVIIPMKLGDYIRKTKGNLTSINGKKELKDINIKGDNERIMAKKNLIGGKGANSMILNSNINDSFKSLGMLLP